MLSKNQLGFLYMFMSICAFSLMDIIVKWSVDYPLGQVLFFRGFFGIIFYFFVIPRDRLHNFYITKIPMKPITTASHLKIPTFSLKKNIDKIVANIGDAKEILTTVAKGNFLKAINIATKAINPEIHLRACRPGLLVL